MNMLIRCKECGKKVSSEAVSCPNCGCPIIIDSNFLEYQKSINRNKKFDKISIFVIFISLIAIIFSVKNNSFKSSNYIDSLDFDSEINSNVIDFEKGVWEKKYFVDEFKNETTKTYVGATFWGTFDNGVAKSEDLLVSVIIDNSNIVFRLFEYGNLEVSNYSDRHYKQFKTTILDKENKTKKIFYSKIEPNDNYVYLDRVGSSYLKSLLNEGKDVSIHMVDVDNNLDSYLFDIEVANFKDFFK